MYNLSIYVAIILMCTQTQVGLSNLNVSIEPFCLPYLLSGQMYTIMTQHSSNLISCLRKKVEADEVIEVKEWVMSLFFGGNKHKLLLLLIIINKQGTWMNCFLAFCCFFAEYSDLTAWMLWPARPSVWTLIPSTTLLILSLQTLRKWSSLTSWIPCLCL